MNYSGSTSRNQVTSTEISTQSKQQKPAEDMFEGIMNQLEYLRTANSEKFTETMFLVKSIVDLSCKKEISKEEIQELDQYYQYLSDINDDFLIWPESKALHVAILETHNVEIIHFFIVRKGVILSPPVYQGILSSFMRSLQKFEFLELPDDEVQRFVSIFEMLVDYGKADLNEPENNTLHTPLHIAVILKQYQFIILLLKKGCDLNRKNTYDETSLDIAIEAIQNNQDVEIYEEIVSLLATFAHKI